MLHNVFAPVGELVRAGQFAKDQQVRYLYKATLFRQLLNGVAPVA